MFNPTRACTFSDMYLLLLICFLEVIPLQVVCSRLKIMRCNYYYILVDLSIVYLQYTLAEAVAPSPSVV